jgi:hypothetical protein
MNLAMLLISAALAQEPQKLDPTDGLLLSVFAGFGAGHFYARSPTSGMMFLATQVGSTVGAIALLQSVADGDITIEEAEKVQKGAIALWVVLGTSRTLEIATVIPAVNNYNEGGWAARQHYPLSDDYDGVEDRNYRGDRPTTMGQPARPPEDLESAMAWKLTRIIYSKLGREPDAEEGLVHSLIERLLDDGYLASVIVAGVDKGIEAVPDKNTAGICEIIRAGLPLTQ